MSFNKELQLEQKQVQTEILNQDIRNNTILTDEKSYSVFRKDKQLLTSFDSGKLIPLIVQEVNPGDIYSIDTKAIIRMSAPSSTPFMNIEYDINWFFVPYTILDSEFKNVMGEQLSYENPNQNDIQFPLLVSSSQTGDIKYNENDLANYLDFPQNIDISSLINNTLKKSNINGINLYPFLAYGKIWNDWYKYQFYDSDIDIESVFNSTRTLDLTTYSDSMDYHESIKYGKGLAPVFKLNDYFTSILPYRQLGQVMDLNQLSLSSLKIKELPIINNSNNKVRPKIYNNSTNGDNSVVVGDIAIGANSGGDLSKIITNRNDNGGNIWFGLTTAETTGSIYSDNNQPYTIHQLRESLANQHYNEILALCGSRYVEQLKSIWGIEVNDIEIQRSEYLGGISDTLIFNNQSQSSSSIETGSNYQLLGNNISSSIYNGISSPEKIEYGATQHGIIMGLINLRTSINYGSQGLPKIFIKNDSYDLYNPYFDNISEQPVYNFELSLNSISEPTTLGYNEPWLEYKYNINSANGFMSLNSNVSLFSQFAFGTKINSNNTIKDLVKYDSNIIGNSLFNVSEQTKQFYHQFIGCFTFIINYSTQMSQFDKPGINYI